MLIYVSTGNSWESDNVTVEGVLPAAFINESRLKIFFLLPVRIVQNVKKNRNTHKMVSI